MKATLTSIEMMILRELRLYLHVDHASAHGFQRRAFPNLNFMRRDAPVYEWIEFGQTNEGQWEVIAPVDRPDILKLTDPKE